jgi:hypothetical protein
MRACYAVAPAKARTTHAHPSDNAPRPFHASARTHRSTTHARAGCIACGVPGDRCLQPLLHEGDAPGATATTFTSRATGRPSGAPSTTSSLCRVANRRSTDTARCCSCCIVAPMGRGAFARRCGTRRSLRIPLDQSLPDALLDRTHHSSAVLRCTSFSG